MVMKNVLDDDTLELDKSKEILHLEIDKYLIELIEFYSQYVIKKKIGTFKNIILIKSCHPTYNWKNNDKIKFKSKYVSAEWLEFNESKIEDIFDNHIWGNIRKYTQNRYYQISYPHLDFIDLTKVLMSLIGESNIKFISSSIKILSDSNDIYEPASKNVPVAYVFDIELMLRTMKLIK